MTSGTITAKTRKRKAKPGPNGCPGPEVVVTSRTPLHSPPAKATSVGPTGEGILEGVATNKGTAEAAHVAVSKNSTSEAFWALLERVGYTVW